LGSEQKGGFFILKALLNKLKPLIKRGMKTSFLSFKN